MPAKKTKRARTDRAPSHDELHKLRETEALFKSNLFRLQTTELLKEASPAYSSAALQGLEAWVRGLRQALLQLPEAELSWERTAGGASCSHEHAQVQAKAHARESTECCDVSGVHAPPR